VGAGDLRAIVKAMIVNAKGGDVQSARLVLAYTLGEPVPCDILERLENLEAMYGHSEKA
jgi:ribosomal protein L17